MQGVGVRLKDGRMRALVRMTVAEAIQVFCW